MRSPDRRDEYPPRRARVIAFYLPQYYPTAENDEWWGPGFTEWTNVARARPLFPGHVQPRIPQDLGFYDLRVPEVREAQAELADRFGVEAFCYWHYWFAGRLMLARPFAEVLASGRPALRFCLGWANQTWTGIWHGAADRILIKQTYPGQQDDRGHFDHLLPAFRDERYLLVDGKPLLYIFRPEQLNEPAAFVDRWQKMATDAGLVGLYLVAEISDLLGAGPVYTTHRSDGFDAGAYVRLPAQVTPASTLKMRLGRKFLRWPERYHYDPQFHRPPPALSGEDIYPCVYPNWDNTPRSGRQGLAITGSSPKAFRSQVRAALDSLESRRPEHRLLFIKSWNEWAEGNYLEPDLEHGRGFLEALGDEFNRDLSESR
jgi:hypothetical protein